ncbi:efflux RND transporter permease subunit [Desmospora profundinema]|uniref:HAE1 family hydrophobic/amphiphilic exporter-1 n=1 Tax=Desmospora profundinema TaxID=1571184 RepID=A0ABU1ILQ0_9BACL|nr:efflux RND transporter permease subunit [Desmospora profundinema]MDR6225621.1 HAE1 family hydrophobic/amphiphilic exporter-1 [Desmospora profundinema]
MWLARSAIRRPVFTTVAVILVLVMGVVSLTNLQMDLLPDIQPPVGAVVASYQGADPEEVLDKVTHPLEQQLGTLAGLKNIQSQTQEGVVLILLEFDWSQDINQVQNDVISRINRTPLPTEVDTPNFLKFDPSTFPIMQLSVLGESREEAPSAEDVDEIVEALSKLPGVASADSSGLLDEQIQVTLDSDALEKWNLSQSDVKEVIEASNLSQPGGIIQDGDEDLTARIVSELTDLDELKKLTVAVDPLNGKKVLLDDVADVKLATEERDVITRTNQQASVGINVFKQSGANTAKVSNAVKAELERLKDERDIGVITIFDQGEYVERSVTNVGTTMIGGAILAMLVLFLFLRSFRSPLIIGVAIPVSVITTFVLMYFSDFSLNIMTLGGLALGVGMLVDNAIVVIENIYRHLQMGEKPQEAASKGAGEVAAAITASTLTTIFVFLPMVFVSGIVGQLFREFAFTVSFSLLASLLVSLTIVPVMASKIMKKPHTGWKKQRDGQKAYRLFRRLVQFALGHRVLVVLLALALLGAGGYGISQVGTEYLPAADEGVFTIEAKMPAGTGLSKTNEMTETIESILKEENHIKHFQVSLGSGRNENAMFGDSGRHIAQFYVNVVDQEERSLSTRSIMNEIRPKLEVLDPDLEVELREQSSFEAAGAPNTLEFTLSGSAADLDEWADEVGRVLLDVEGVQEVTDSRQETRPELQVVVDRKKAEDNGLVPAQVIAAVSEATRGETVTLMNLNGRDIHEVFLRYEKTFRQSPEKLKDLPIPTAGDSHVKLSEVADVKVEEGPIVINRSNLQDSIEYQVQFDDTDLGTVEREVTAKLDEIGLPTEMDVQFTGSAELFQDALEDLTLAAGLAVLFVFLVLAAQFESFKYPFVIILTLPLMVIGVALALFFTQTPVGVTAMIGVIVLAGIVVNNAIVLVDYINQLKDRGMASYDAIVEASLTRARPILMTATTTILGLIPLSLGLGEGTEIQQPLAIAVIGGLLSSTLLTLVVIPIVYSWFDPATRRLNKRKKKEATE